MYTILIVDDEPLARLRLQRFIDTFEKFECIDEASNGQEAIEKSRELQPDIILLDIRMPLMMGTEAALPIKAACNGQIIFCTAYNDYAVEAFEAEAQGYLLKPVAKAKLQQALEKAVSKLSSTQEDSFITVKQSHKVFTIPLSSIRYCLAEQKYVTLFYLSEGQLKQQLIDLSLKELEEQYHSTWLRIHRNALIAKAHLTGIERADGHYHALLGGGEQSSTIKGPKISRRQLTDIKQFIEGH